VLVEHPSNDVENGGGESSGIHGGQAYRRLSYGSSQTKR
jgi:hypothetical protein